MRLKFKSPFYKSKMNKALEQFKSDMRNYLKFDRDYIKSLELVYGKDVKSTGCYMNSKCHMVSRTIANANSFMKVIPCIAISETHTMVHFINYDMENEVYIDNTLGVEARDYEFYIMDCWWLNIETHMYKNSPNDALNVMKRDWLTRFVRDKKLRNEMIEYFGIDDII